MNLETYINAISHINNKDILLGFPISFNTNYDYILYTSQNRFLNALQVIGKPNEELTYQTNNILKHSGISFLYKEYIYYYLDH